MMMPHRAFKMAAAVQNIVTCRKTGLIFRAIGITRDAGIDVVLYAVEVLVEHEIDHAGHGIGAINRRSASGHDIDPAHQHLWQHIDIDGAVGVGRRNAMAVEQDQGALGAEIAQVQHIAVAIGARGSGVIGPAGADENRQFVQGVRNIGRRGRLKFGRGDDGDWGWRIDRVGDNARAGDNHGLDAFRVLGSCGGCERESACRTKKMDA